MKLKHAVSLAILLPLLAACGGSSSSSDDDDGGTPDVDGGGTPDVDGGGGGVVPDGMSEGDCCLLEDRTPPAAGTTLVSNTSLIDGDAGPQAISPGNQGGLGLRYGDFLMLNNAFNSSNTDWDGWSQSIRLNDGSPVTMDLEWDWGLESQKPAPFETISFPELVYGTKSAFERSGDFQATGLPIEESDRPEIRIDYSYSRTAGTTDAPLGGNDTAADASNSEHNVIIESFWHSSCNIIRNGGANDNQVMELLIWYYHGERLPSGPLDVVEENAMVDGFPFTVYAKGSNNGFLAYVAQDVESAERQAGSINYSAFIDHMNANAARYGVYEVQPTDCFANILFGPEVFFGSGTFTINDFTITQQY